MKNLMVLVLAIAFIGLMGCEQSDLQSEVDYSSESELRSCQLNLRNTEGLQHNLMVQAFYTDFDWCFSNQASSLNNYKNVLLQNSTKYAPIINMSDSDFDSLVTSLDIGNIYQNLDFRNLIMDDLIEFVKDDQNISSDLSDAVVSVLNYVENYNFVTNGTAEFESDLCLFLQNHPSSLSVIDQSAYDVFIDVLVYSNKLWLEPSIGGLNYATKFQELNNNNCLNFAEAQLRWSWGKFFAVDAVGTLATFTATAIVTVSSGGTLGPAAGAASVVAGVGGSIIYAIAD